MRTRSARKLVVHVAGLAALSLVLSACFYPLAVHHQNTSPDTRPWWCNSMGGEGTHGSQYYMDQGIVKGPLSWEDCLEISAQFDAALEFAQQWPTRGEAEADGWNALVNYATGMGTHHSRGGLGSFNPEQPTFLQYDGNGPGAKLVGMSWFVNNGPDAPPEGFAGDNDWWHTHEYLCLVNGMVVYDGTCEEGGIPNGNTAYLGNFWLLHAWIVPGWNWQPDVFIGHHPCLLPGGPAGPDHECWDMDGGHMG